MEIDVIGSLSPVGIYNDADIATAVGFLGEANEKRAVVLLADGSRHRAAILRPADAHVGLRDIAAEMHGRPKVRELLVIGRLRCRSIGILYEWLLQHAIKYVQYTFSLDKHSLCS